MKSYIISSSDVKYETNISMEDTPLEIVIHQRHKR